MCSTDPLETSPHLFFHTHLFIIWNRNIAIKHRWPFNQRRVKKRERLYSSRFIYCRCNIFASGYCPRERSGRKRKKIFEMIAYWKRGKCSRCHPIFGIISEYTGWFGDRIKVKTSSSKQTIRPVYENFKISQTLLTDHFPWFPKYKSLLLGYIR